MLQWTRMDIDRMVMCAYVFDPNGFLFCFRIAEHISRLASVIWHCARYAMLSLTLFDTLQCIQRDLPHGLPWPLRTHARNIYR